MSPTWIVPPLLGSLFLVGVYGYLFVRYREPFLGVWTWGWGLYTLRFAALVPVALGAAGPGWRVANQMFALWSGVLLFRGVREFQGKRLARGWVATGAALSAWVAAGPSLSVPFAVYTLPTFAFLGFVNWEAGRALLSKRGRLADAEGPARLTGTAFLLWAIHKWDYPFLARLPWAAPWGYALGAVLGLATAVGLLVTYLERERNRAERNRLFLRGVLDAIPDRVAVLDPELRVLDANRAAGIQAERHGGVCCGDVRGDSAPWCEDGGCVAAAALEQGVTVRATRRGADENGRPVVWDVLAAPLRDGAGRLVGAVRVARDVTERELLAEQVSHAAAEWAATFDAVPDLIVVTDGAGLIRRANRELASRLGKHPRDLVGRTLDEAGLAGLADVSLVRGIGEWESPDLGGVFLVSATLVRLGDGASDGWVYVGRDVTDAKALERERVRTQHLEALGIFAAGIAHDFNNLLMGISGNLELAERRLARGSGAAEVSLQRAREACSRATGLARQLLTFSRGGEPVRRRMNLAGVLGEWVRFPLAGSPVLAAVEVEPGLPDLEADGEQIHQVVTNLVVNARQAMPEGGTLRVRAEAVDLEEGATGPRLPPGRYVRLTVADEGCGIPAEHLDRIFDPFFTTKPDGSGLGLATSYSIVRRHGGAIHVASEPGRGTTVEVYLPAAGAEALEDRTPPRGYQAPSLRGLRVLAMDDDPVLRQILAERLAEEGIEARVVSSGEEAVEAFAGALRAGAPPHAVVLDLTVRGGLGGEEALERIRDLSREVFAVAVSGYAEAPAVARPREHGFDAAMAKPYALADLLRVIAEGVGGRAG